MHATSLREPAPPRPPCCSGQGCARVRAHVCRYVRHPGYLGWYLWCIGGQLLLVNPLCAAAFALVVSE